MKKEIKIKEILDEKYNDYLAVYLKQRLKAGNENITSYELKSFLSGITAGLCISMSHFAKTGKDISEEYEIKWQEIGANVSVGGKQFVKDVQDIMNKIEKHFDD